NSHFVTENPVSGDYIFSESGESFRSNNRKRYKGENNPDIKSWDPLSGKFTMLTEWEGKDLWPTVENGGNIWFASDEGTGEYNLFGFSDGKKEQLTHFSSSIGRPQVNASGNRIVFTLDYQIYTYDCTSGKSEPLKVDIFSSRPYDREVSFSTDDKISAFDVSPDNKKIAFVSRGRLFVSDVKGEFVREMNTDPTERVLEVLWTSDNKTMLITRTNGGWPNLYRITSDGKGPEQPVKVGESKARMVSLNKNRDKAVYYFGRSELRMTDMKTWDDRLLVNDEFWFRGSQPGFSPDDRYVYYTSYRHFETDIKLLELKTSRVINITNTFLSEGDPFWSPDNRYIWFTADRTAASYPRGGGETRLYRIPLQKFSKPFKSDKVDELLGGAVSKPTPAGAIDTTDLLRRWESPLTVGPGQSNPYVIDMDTVTYVLFNSRHEGKQAVYKLSTRPFGASRVEEIKGLRSASFVSAGKDYYAISGGKIYKVNIKGNKADAIDIKYDFTRSLTAEFNQMFYEGWTVLAENYYDENMHGTDWKLMKEKYEKFLPYVRSRSELSTVMNDMLGELNSSHMGFRSTGDEQKLRMNMVTAATGIIFDKANPYRVDRIITYSPADNIEAMVKMGDIMVKVNGIKTDNSHNRESYFLFPKMPEEIELVFDRGGKEVLVKLHPVPASAINGMLYDEWIASNQERVDQLSGN
ncbi:MAG: peptidase S41, partial [Bacteroidia bacterium]